MIPDQILLYLNTNSKIAKYTIEPVPYIESGLAEDDTSVEHYVIHVTKRNDDHVDLDFFRIIRTSIGLTIGYSAFPGFHNDFNNRMVTKEIVDIYDAKLQ